MKIAIFGSNGMLGHQLVNSWADKHELFRIARAPSTKAPTRRTRGDFFLDVRDAAAVQQVLHEIKPDAIVNAIGIVKQRPQAKEGVESVAVNSLFPHQLAAAAADVGARVVHLSTDCVFTGQKGMYTESDVPDARDMYGRSKLLGELTDYAQAITLRTSIIGLEIANHHSLIEWFLAQNGAIKGFRRAIYSGFTTLEMARIIEMILERFPEKRGLYHVSSEPIDKYTLLTKLKSLLGKDVAIEEDNKFHCDRSMESGRFREELSYTPPSWDRMLEELSIQIKESQR